MSERIWGTLYTWGYITKQRLELALRNDYMDFDVILQGLEWKSLAGKDQLEVRPRNRRIPALSRELGIDDRNVYLREITYILVILGLFICKT